MANTLTGLIQYVYDSVDVVSRELVGLVPAVYKNTSADQVAKNQDISYDIVPAAVLYDVAPSNALPDLDTTTVAAGTMKIDKVRATKFHWTGDDERAIGRQAKNNIQENKFSQAFRALANEMEDDLAALYAASSRAYGTAGTTPFGTAGDFSDAAEVVRILKDNGAPTTDLQLVINTAAGAKVLGKQSQAHMVGTTDPQRSGTFLDISGCRIRESAAIKNHTKGDGTGFLINSAGNYAVGATTLALDTGINNILAGDIVTIADDPSEGKYVVGAGHDAGAGATAGNIVIGAPGLRGAVLNNKAVTIGNDFAANMAFSKSAIHLLTRLPLMPEGGDQADDVMIVQDPHSGIYFQVALYRAYRSVLIEVAVAWGVKAAKTEHMALLLG